MAKNQRFHVKYVVEAKGISTNGFVPKIIEGFLKSYVRSINAMYQQTNIKLKKDK